MILEAWKAINEILNQTKRKKHFPQYFKDSNNLLTNKQLISISLIPSL